MRGRVALATAIVVVPLLGYPLFTITGGWPQFHSRGECARTAQADDDEFEVVYGRLDDPLAAETLLAELTGIGFVGAEVELDDCGRWKVSYTGIDSFEQGEALAEQVRGAGFDARVEVES